MYRIGSIYAKLLRYETCFKNLNYFSRSRLFCVLHGRPNAVQELIRDHCFNHRVCEAEMAKCLQRYTFEAPLVPAAIRRNGDSTMNVLCIRQLIDMRGTEPLGGAPDTGLSGSPMSDLSRHSHDL